MIADACPRRTLEGGWKILGMLHVFSQQPRMLKHNYLKLQ